MAALFRKVAVLLLLGGIVSAAVPGRLDTPFVVEPTDDDSGDDIRAHDDAGGPVAHALPPETPSVLRVGLGPAQPLCLPSPRRPRRIARDTAIERGPPVLL